MAKDQVTATETELAFNLLGPPKQFIAHPLFENIEPQTKLLETVYYDTPSHMLSRTLWSLSVRTTDGGQPVQRVKGPKFSATRPEFETPIDSVKLNLGVLRDTPIWRQILGHDRELDRVFSTHVQRTVFNIHTPSSTIEVALDQGHIRTPDGQTLPINDVEFELKSGSIGSLFTIATRFSLDIGMMLEVASKAERGYALVNDAKPLFHKHGEIVIPRNATTLAGFRVIVDNILAHLQSNLKAAYASDPNGVHQLRVAIRRLRAALFMFRHLLTREIVQSFDLELKHFGRIFGDARDWDVFLTQTLPAVSKESAQSDWRALIEPLAIETQQRAHRQLRQQLEGRAFNSLLLSIMGWVEEGLMLQTSPKLKRPIRDTLPDLLSALNDRVDHRLRKLDGSEKALHDLRKAIKTLRYGVEFVGSLYGTRAVRKFIAPCRSLQEALGAVNDVSVTQGLISNLTSATPALAPALAHLHQWLNANKTKSENQVPKLVKMLREDDPFWD